MLLSQRWLGRAVLGSRLSQGSKLSANDLPDDGRSLARVEVARASARSRAWHAPSRSRSSKASVGTSSRLRRPGATSAAAVAAAVRPSNSLSPLST
jgi:hypothetical protein